MRWLAPVLLCVAALAGCTSDEADAPARAVTPVEVGHDPSMVHVAGTRLDNVTIPSFDGATSLAALIRVPLTNDTLPDGSAPRWPVVVFLHGWGSSKEAFAGGRGGVPGSQALASDDRLQEFAAAGFLAVAYDARGFGQSGGNTDVAGPATMGDLDSVLDWVEAHYRTSGRVGLMGESYGAGQALLALAKDPRVTTAVPMYGWVDLADALIPHNVPKLEWGQFLYGYGLVGSHGRYDAMLHAWYQDLYLRENLDGMRAQMEVRSAGAALAGSPKPLLVCQGLAESLFPQADRTRTAGFTRTYIHPGGHGADDGGCWSRALDWFSFFLAGFDTRVDAWPALETADALATGAASYEAWPVPAPETSFLRAPDLVATASDATFTVRQSPSMGLDPSVLPDNMGGLRPPVPEPLRQDPAAVVFNGVALDSPRTIAGAPTLRLAVQSGTPPFQVAAELLVVHADGTSVPLGHAAYAALDADDAGAALEMQFEWTHATLAQGDHLQLRVQPNDPSWWMPLLADYTVTFGGASQLDVPYL